MPSINHAIARIDAVLSGQRSRADADFNEADHPRASNGQFGSGGGSFGGGSGGGSGGAPSRPKPAKSKSFFGSIKEAFSTAPSVKLAGEDLIEASAEHSRIKRALEKAPPRDKGRLEGKLRSAAKKMAEAEKAHSEAVQWHKENGPEAEAKAERERQAEEDRYWASKRGPHPLDKAKGKDKPASAPSAPKENSEKIINSQEWQEAEKNEVRLSLEVNKLNNQLYNAGKAERKEILANLEKAESDLEAAEKKRLSIEGKSK